MYLVGLLAIWLNLANAFLFPVTYQEPLELFVPLRPGTLYDIRANESYIGMVEQGSGAVVLDFWLPVACYGSRITALKERNDEGQLFLVVHVDCRVTTTSSAPSVLV